MIIRPYLVALAALLPLRATAQQHPPLLPQPETRGQVIEFLRSSDPARRAGGYETAVGILTGALEPPGLGRDAVAQDLVSVAVSDTGLARLVAAAALIASGQRNKPKRYAGAARRLAEVFQRATHPGTRGVAMDGFVQVASLDSAFVFLKSVAATPNSRIPTEQYAAINLIAGLDTDVGAAFLRELDKGGTVTDPNAVRALRLVAATGYRRRPPKQ